MKENDYYGHYKAFINELKQNPEQTLQIYCRDHGVMWRRLYDWMRRLRIPGDMPALTDQSPQKQ